MNTKMKTLSLAVLGLVGFAAAGSAMAQCPTTLNPPWNGGVTATAGGSASSVTTGLDGSACKLQTRLGNSFNSQATVTDNTPSNETRYRFQFLVDPDALGTYANQDSVTVFSANSADAFPASGGSRQILKVVLSAAGSGNKRLTFIAACNNPASSYRCIANSPNLTAGVNRIEVDLTVGASASAKYWLNAAVGTTEPAETGTVTLTNGNAGWVGVNQAVLGLAAPSPTWKNSHNGKNVFFDTFDSRRQTYIGR